MSVLNLLGDRLLNLAHRARPNTIKVRVRSKITQEAFGACSFIQQTFSAHYLMHSPCCTEHVPGR